MKVLKFTLWWVLFFESISSFRWKSTEELSLIAVMSDAKFEEKLALGCKNDITNLVNFNTNNDKSENLHFDVIFPSKTCNVWAKKIEISGAVKNDL